MVVDCASAGRALAGQTRSGDRGVVLPFPGGALVAVIDGLGHGDEADAAAEAAHRVLAGAPSEDVSELVRRCHEALRRTRGVVMSLASFHRDKMTWLGVGNVEGVLVRGSSSEVIATRGGTIAYTLPPLNPRSLAVAPGDTLVLASDGIKHGFKAAVSADRSPQEIAELVIAEWAKPTDDAQIVVARYVGATVEGER